MSIIQGHTRERPVDSVKIVFPPITGWATKQTYFPQSEAKYSGAQKTVSIGHRKNPQTGKYDSGGPFYTCSVRPKINSKGVHLKSESESFDYEYRGPVVPPIPVPGGTFSGFALHSGDLSGLNKWGANAIAATEPTNPNALVGVSLGELLIDRRVPIMGIPTWENRTRLVRAAGSEYLNAVFGWLPLVKDMKSVAQSVRDSATILENYQANRGTEVHREFAFDDIVSEEESIISSGTRCLYSSSTNIKNFNSTPVPLFRQRKTTTKRWFSGTYLLPITTDSVIAKTIGARNDADKLFGISPTPDTIWDLAPWSWAVDWFSNTGNVLKNFTAFKLAGLVMKYGYIMEETSTTDTYYMPDTGLIAHGQVPRSEVVYNHKLRNEADPFGFGIAWEGLSPTQLAITAALGITRLR